MLLITLIKTRRKMLERYCYILLMFLFLSGCETLSDIRIKHRVPPQCELITGGALRINNYLQAQATQGNVCRYLQDWGFGEKSQGVYACCPKKRKRKR